MTLTDAYPPIALATVANVILFALAWRGNQIERQRGSAPWYLVVGLLSYVGALGGIFYILKDRPLRGGFDYFVAAMIGEAAATVVLYSLLEAFVRSRGKPWRERFVPAVFSLGAIALMLAALFKG